VLSQVNVVSAQGEILNLVLADVSDGYALEDVGGLGPVKATLVSTSFANQDGSQAQSAKRESRNITMKIGLEADHITTHVRALRQRLYDFFMTKSIVTMSFVHDDEPDIVPLIVGQVETCEPDMFTQEPLMNISILCYDPDFVDPDTVTVTGNTSSGSTPGTVTYDGSVETGVIFTLSINRTLAEFSIFNSPPGENQQKMDVSYPFVSGDVLTISTMSGNKYVTLTRGGSDIDLLYAISPQSAWIELKRGDNAFLVYASGAAIPWSMDYLTRYGGL
jgi:hypothetical protein